MKLTSIRKIAPEVSRCIEVDAPDRLFAVGGTSGSRIVTHNSVVQRNIILGCILRPQHWRFMGIDLKKVELSPFKAYKNVVLGIATELEDARLVLRFGQETMMRRYSEMEQLGVNNFLDLPEKSPSLLIMIDELGELVSASNVKTEQGKADDEAKGEISMMISSIARLGRAAGVHLVLATQRPDATLLPGELKANLGVRVNCGRTDPTASSMILGSGEGSRVKASPKGRIYLSIFGSGNHGQGFFADPAWIDNYLASQGLNPDGTPLTKKRSRLANYEDISSFDGMDLDAREGVDNAAAIERIRQEEEAEELNSSSFGDDDWSITEDDEDDSEEEFDLNNLPSSAPADAGGGIQAPVLGGKKDSADKWHRPEDDWDNELEDLIRANNEE